jgi:hypothetical protein
MVEQRDPAPSGWRVPAPARRQQSDVEGSAYAVVWRTQPDGSIRTEIVDENGVVVADPGGLGIELPPVDPGFPRSPEPEAWVQRGSVVVCFSIDQNKGCLKIED